MSTFVNKVSIPQLKKRKINISCEILIKFETELHLFSSYNNEAYKRIKITERDLLQSDC